MVRRRLSGGLTGPTRALGALLVAAMVLSGCASHLADSVPAAVGGLPEKIPPRSDTAAEFPAVHDRPAPRAEGLLSEAERKKLKDDLTASRDRTTRLSQPSDQPAKKKVAEPAAKKKKAEPTATGSLSAAGAAPNP